MTIRQAQAILRPLGIILRWMPEYGEYRVNFRGGSEETAYYTNDRDDAVGTGQDMARRGFRPSPYRKNPRQPILPASRVGQLAAQVYRRSGVHSATHLERITEAHAQAYRVPTGDVYEWARKWLSRRELRDNPCSILEHPNPGRANGHIPGSVLEVRYRRGPGKYYQHTFKPGVHQRNNVDGSVTLYHPSRRIWADDREPGFWRKYGDHNPRRGGGRMAKSTPWLTYGLVGLAIYLIMKNQPDPGAGVATVTLPGGGSTVTAPDILSGG